MKEEVLIRLNNVYAAYDHRLVLEDVSLEIRNRDFIGVIGPNGGGKTTLLRILLKLMRPLKGEVSYTGGLKRQSIGYLPQMQQTDRQFPITVEDVVLSGLMGGRGRVSRFTGADRQKARQALQEMGVENLRKRPLGMLSGGQIQRVLLARAIVGHPRLLVLDEPGNYVDNEFEHDMYQRLKRLNEEMAIMMVSHDVGTISAHVKSIACVNQKLHYHASGKVTNEQLKSYGCPIQLIAHGPVPHTVLEKHSKG